MSDKDDPLNQSSYAPRALWLNRENNIEARDNWWQAYNELEPTSAGNRDDRHIWNVAWAASIAAFSYLQEGRTGPRP
jgi:hypothetical protein